MASILERNNKLKQPQKTREEHAQDALYREVWEDVNNEKTQKFIKKYYKHIIAGALVLLIAITAIQIGIRTHNAHKLATAMNYEAALSNVDATALAAIGNDSSGATADLALFQSYILDKDITKLESLAKNGHTRDFRDLARMHIVSLRGDEMTGAQVEEFLSGMNTKKSPFYYTSRLIIAEKYLSTGARDDANRFLDVIINDADAPAIISATAQTLR